MNREALKQELLDLLKEQCNLRMKKSTRQLTQTHQLKRVRRAIARVKTQLKQQVGAL